jgi:hypothetical protein
MGPRFAEMLTNVDRNLGAGRIRVIRLIVAVR